VHGVRLLSIVKRLLGAAGGDRHDGKVGASIGVEAMDGSTARPGELGDQRS
jgi:hypothetical protein